VKLQSILRDKYDERYGQDKGAALKLIRGVAPIVKR
jgi:hypothetical protein